MNEDTNKTFAERLTYYLRRYDLTNVMLAEKLGVSVAMVGQWRSGKHSPRMDKIDVMCNIFKCTRSELLDPKTEPCESSLERELLAIFRTLDDESKARVIDFAGWQKVKK